MLKRFIGVVLAGLLVAGIALAAPTVAQAAEAEFSTEQITSFANAYQQVQGIQFDAEEDMVEAVAAEGLTVAQFNQILDVQRGESIDPSIADPSEEQLSQFDNAVEQIVSIRAAAQVEMEAAIADTGLALETFGQMMTQAQTDPDLREQISEQLMAD